MGDSDDFIENPLLFRSAVGKPRLQLRGTVKMVFNQALAAVGDNQDIRDAGADGLFHNILDGGLVHDGQHFLRHGLCGGKNPRPKPRGGDDGFFDFHGNRS